MTLLTKILTDIGIWIGGVFLIGISLVTGVDVLLRKFANISLEGLHEIGGFAMAIAFAWAMPFTILTRGHVRVDIVYAQATARWKLVLDLFAAFAFAFYLTVLVQHCYALTVASWEASTLSIGILRVPLAIPQAIWTAGLGVACLVLVVAVARACSALIRGRVTSAIEALAPYSVGEGETGWEGDGNPDAGDLAEGGHR